VRPHKGLQLAVPSREWTAQRRSSNSSSSSCVAAKTGPLPSSPTVYAERSNKQASQVVSTALTSHCVLCACCCAGLTKVPIDGQPPSIVQDLEDMCRQYIKVGAQPGPAQHTQAMHPLCWYTAEDTSGQHSKAAQQGGSQQDRLVYC
jgi:hypothetical protein